MNARHSVTIKSHPRHLAEVRQFVRGVAAEAGASEDVTFKCVLAVDEAVANIIRHAYDGDETQDIVIHAEHNRDMIEFRLRDFGHQSDTRTFKSRDLADIRPGGLGCHLIAQGFDLVSYNTDLPSGTELRLVKRLGRCA